MVGIIVLNYNSAEDTMQCVAAIEKYTTTAYQIYIVDGASNDGSLSKLTKRFAGNNAVKIIKSDINGGYSYGNNLGVQQAAQDGVDAFLIINPDVVLLNNAVGIMYDALRAQDALAVVGPRVYGPHKEDMQFAMRLLTFTNFIWQRKPFCYLNSNALKGSRFYAYKQEEDFIFEGMVSGCCFMIKANTFNSSTLFDEQVFLYFEEDIISYKLKGLNKLTAICASAEVRHEHSSSVNKEGEAFIRYHRFYSSEYVLKRYAGINNFELFVVSCFHLLPFSFNAIFKATYRKYYWGLMRKILSIYKIKNEHVI